MTPTFVRGPERTLVIGTPGGSRIITMVLLGILEFVDGADAKGIVGAQRIHHQYLPDAISAEPLAMPTEMVHALEAMGHAVNVGSREWGNMQVAIWNRVSGEYDAASDPRNDSGRASIR